MTPLAGLLVEKGERVLGSDLLPLYPPMSERIAQLGIPVAPGFSAANLPEGVDRVVVGNLASADNPELLEARRRGIPAASMPETLYHEVLAGRHPVVVTGTHGKTTTTALTAFLLSHAGRRPGWLVGGEPLSLAGPGALGEGEAFVLEGDEYSTSYADKGPKFLHYAPRTLILTSIEFDHADLYPDLPSILAVFRQVVALVPPDGLVVANAEDPNVLSVLDAARAPVLLYGIDEGGGSPARLVARDVTRDENGSSFDVLFDGTLLLHAKTALAGRHNVSNALAAVGASRVFGLSPAEIASGLAAFLGVKRRLEELGTASGVTVVDDFAHHPTAVATTLEGARRRYPGRRLWAAFEPRSLTAGRAEFAVAYESALANADAAALCAPFHAARLGRSGGPGALDVAGLAERLVGSGRESFAAADPEALTKELLLRLREGDVVLSMSSGSFGGFPRKLLAELGAR
jgi:UDP-N-acetylmuramate: L-alanyl-gamma-D-glutamyl-meso-diaminopimelate ligase